MTINQLTYLVAVVEGGINLSRASRRLGVSQPNISKQLALLEEEIGHPIFERAGRRLLALTPVGRQLFRHALNVTEELVRLHEDVSPETVERTVAIGSTMAMARYVLPGMLAAAAPETRGITVEIHTLPSEDIGQAVLEGRCDFGLISGTITPEPNLLLLPWYRWRYRLIFSKSSNIRSELIRSGDFLRNYPIAACASVAGNQSAVLRAMEKLGVTPQIRTITPNVDEVKAIVRSNRHVGLIAEMAYSEHVDKDLDSCDSPASFPTLLAWIAIRRQAVLREGVATLLEGIASHLQPTTIERLRRKEVCNDPALVARGVRIPRYG